MKKKKVSIKFKKGLDRMIKETERAVAHVNKLSKLYDNAVKK